MCANIQITFVSRFVEALYLRIYIHLREICPELKKYIIMPKIIIIFIIIIITIIIIIIIITIIITIIVIIIIIIIIIIYFQH